MGLPVFRESAVDEPTTKTDPTAQARSTIRRHIRRSVAPSLQRSSTSRVHRAQYYDVETTSTSSPALRPTEASSDLRLSIAQSTTTARPRSRRGPSRDFDNMPPLRRVGNRRIVDETDRNETQHRPAAAVVRVNGLGDRERSWSPDGETDTWAVMGSTIEPDANLPSASTSFASGADRVAETQVDPYTRSQQITSFFAPDNEPSDDHEETLRVLGELDRQVRMSRTEAQPIQGANIGTELNLSTYDEFAESVRRQQQTDSMERLSTPPELRESLRADRRSTSERSRSPPPFRRRLDEAVSARSRTPPALRQIRELVSRRESTTAPMRAPTPPANRNLDPECPNLDQTVSPAELDEETRRLHHTSTQFLHEINELLLGNRHPGETTALLGRMLAVIRDESDRLEGLLRRQIASRA